MLRKTIVLSVALVLALVLPTLAGAATYSPQGQTVGLTSITFTSGPGTPDDAVCRVPFYVFATDHTGNVAQWFWLVATRKVDTDPLGILVGTPDVKKTVGATAWTATLSVVNDRINATVTGVLGATVDWMQTNDESFCMAGPIV